MRVAVSKREARLELVSANEEGVELACNIKIWCRGGGRGGRHDIVLLARPGECSRKASGVNYGGRFFLIIRWVVVAFVV